MQLTLTRFSSGPIGTLGLLRVDGRFDCFSLEDPFQAGPKIPGETRIPAGTYRILLRTEGGFHNRYRKTFADIHRGMLWLQDVPNFEWVLFHRGNTKKDTRGCICVGEGADRYAAGGGTIANSTRAYRRFYPPVAAALVSGERVDVTIEDAELV